MAHFCLGVMRCYSRWSLRLALTTLPTIFSVSLKLEQSSESFLLKSGY